VLALCTLILLVLLGGAGAALGSVLATRSATAAAADLAALAAAGALVGDPGGACDRAARVATVNGARVTACRVSGTDAWVVVQSPAPVAVAWLLRGRTGTLRARAHARLAPGPAGLVPQA